MDDTNGLAVNSHTLLLADAAEAAAELAATWFKPCSPRLLHGCHLVAMCAMVLAIVHTGFAFERSRAQPFTKVNCSYSQAGVNTCMNTCPRPAVNTLFIRQAGVNTLFIQSSRLSHRTPYSPAHSNPHSFREHSNVLPCENKYRTISTIGTHSRGGNV